jgi:ATP-binding protein involved in chromosome partitioning
MPLTSYRPQPGLKPLANIKNIIAVGSGKGGVGKSTLSVNLALALHHLGYNVGLLDADIYGPSVPQMLGSYDSPEMTADKKIQPIKRHGIDFISIGNLVDPDNALIWRGPMVSSALQQLLNDTQWPELDVLIVDLPPGTGDIQLTMAQKIPVSGAVVVTTPQDLSLIDAKRAIAMFNKVNIHLLGLIENMSTFVCPHCHQQTVIFGEHGAQQLAASENIPLLGQLPLHADIRSQTDSGTPTVVADPQSAHAQQCIQLTTKLLDALMQLPKDYSALMPDITVE